MRRSFLYVLIGIALVAIAAAAALQSVAVDTWIFRLAVRHAVAAGNAKLAGANELAVVLVGTGTPLPDVSRAGPSTLIAAGDHLYLVDAGVDSARNLQLWKVPLNKIDAVFITHLHSDHIGGLADVRLQTWVAGRKRPLKVYGPPGIELVVAGFNEAYAIDDTYRTKHHGAAMLPPAAAKLAAIAIVIPAGRTTTSVLDQSGLTVTAVRVKHEPANPAYGYRFDFAGRSVTISGDTIYDEDLAHAAQGTDVLVHEALAPELVAIMHDELMAAGRPRPAKIMHDIPGYHTTPIEAARIANLAHAKLLLYTHLLPVVPNWIAMRAFIKGVADVRPEGVKVGHDGLIVHLQGASQAIEIGDIDGGSMPPCTEEFLQERSRRRGVAQALDLGAMVAGRLRKETRAIEDRAALGILGRKHQTLDAGETDRAGAHRTRFERNEERRPDEPLIAELGRP